jgi:hypothetical protein
MREKYQIRVDPGLRERLQRLAVARSLSSSEIARLALELGLDILEDQRRVNFVRLAVLLETMLPMVDYIGQKIGAEKIELAPHIAAERMDKYHAEI